MHLPVIALAETARARKLFGQRKRRMGSVTDASQVLDSPSFDRGSRRCRLRLALHKPW